MGNVAGWLTGCLFPEEQALWHAASAGDHRGLRDAIARLTPETRRYLDWQDSCSGRTPLAQSAARGKADCIKTLVEAGANVNTKDYKGNTPLHLACRYGHAEAVRCLVHLVNVVPFEVNMALMTPLDVARDRLRSRGGDEEGHSRKSVAGFEDCIAELEKKFYIYSGWLYEKADNLLSTVSGISSLSSWKHRFCIVLQRGMPDILELALFSVKKGAMRPALPSSVILYHVQSGITETTESAWFGRKNFTFKATGSVLIRDGCRTERRQAASTHTVEFAAADADGFDMWKNFFHHHQEMFEFAQGRHPTYAAPHVDAAPAARPSLPVYYTPTPEALASISTYPADLARAPRQRSADSSDTSIATMSVLRDEEEEDEDLRRAIELSLRESQPVALGGGPDSLSPPLPIVSSAPAWTDDEDESLGGSYTGQSDRSSTSETAAGGDRSRHTIAEEPLVSFSRAPSYSSIGECVICFDGPQAAVCVPCGHNAVCMSCAEEILDTTCECPVCRQPIRELIKLYRV